MAKRGRKGRRDTVVIANTRVLSDPVSPRFFRSFTPAVIIDDGRTWHPLGDDRPALRFSSVPARLTVVDRPASRRARQAGFSFQPLQTKAVRAFARPDDVVTCVRRQERREVLFATNRARGSGAGRRTWRSKVKC